MLADAHIHFHDLAKVDPGFLSRYDPATSLASASSHDEAEFRATEAWSATTRWVLTFGIHPQWPVGDHAAFLEGLAKAGRIGAIGEAGFDFFGDVPERVRNEANEARQTEAFEFQLALAEATDLPLLLHLRKATDKVYAYSKRLKRLKALVFHAWPGTAHEALDLLDKGLPAWFSFGTPVLRDHKRARECCALLPAGRLLSETDAPWQPLRGRDFTAFEDLAAIQAEIARLRGLGPGAVEEILEANFRAAYGLGRA